MLEKPSDWAPLYTVKLPVGEHNHKVYTFALCSASQTSPPSPFPLVINAVGDVELKALLEYKGNAVTKI